MSTMDPQMEKLLVLQEREQRKMRLDRELAAWPTEMKSLESKKMEIRAGAERKKQEAQQTEVERKKLEFEDWRHKRVRGLGVGSGNRFCTTPWMSVLL